jgi:hypothetical protein
MTSDVPDTGPEFERLMREIDAAFAHEGVPIPSRPLKSMLVISSRYKISLPLVPPGLGSPPELQRYAQFGENIHD